MTIDRECERSRVPVNDGRRTTKVVRRVRVNVVFRIETLLVRLVRVGCRGWGETFIRLLPCTRGKKTYKAVGLLARGESCQSAHSARYPTFLDCPRGRGEEQQAALARG